MQDPISPTTESGDLWNDAAALIAQGRFPALLRPFWWCWRIYNATRPTSIFGRLLHLCLTWYIVFVTLNGAFLEIPKDRVWGWLFLAVGALAFCQACGRRKVKIVKRPAPKPAPPRLHAVPEPDVHAARNRQGG
jgi:hypothetical protein